MVYKILTLLCSKSKPTRPTRRIRTQFQDLTNTTPRKPLFSSGRVPQPTETIIKVITKTIIINGKEIPIKIESITTRYRITSIFQLLHLDLSTITKIIFKRQ
jgi:hypothetical protein